MKKHKKVLYKDLTYMERLIHKESLKYAFPKFSVLFYIDDQAVGCAIGSEIILTKNTIETTCNGSPKKRVHRGNTDIMVKAKRFVFDGNHHVDTLIDSFIERKEVIIRYSPEYPTNKREEKAYQEGEGMITNVSIQGPINDITSTIIELSAHSLTNRR